MLYPHETRLKHVTRVYKQHVRQGELKEHVLAGAAHSPKATPTITETVLGCLDTQGIFIRRTTVSFRPSVSVSSSC